MGFDLYHDPLPLPFGTILIRFFRDIKNIIGLNCSAGTDGGAGVAEQTLRFVYGEYVPIARYSLLGTILDTCITENAGAATDTPFDSARLAAEIYGIDPAFGDRAFIRFCR